MVLFRILLLFCLPAFLLRPIPTFSQEVALVAEESRKELYVPRDSTGRVNPWALLKVENFTYDRVFEFAELLEQDAFWENLSPDEFDILMDYCLWAVEFSAPKNRLDLQENAEREIDDLLNILEGKDSSMFLLGQNMGYHLQPAYFYQQPHFQKCGLGKAWKRVKKWTKKNKGPIIICAVVVAVIVVAAATGGVGGSTATAVGGALAAGIQDDSSPSSDHINKPGEVEFQDDLPKPSALPSSAYDGGPSLSTTPSLSEERLAKVTGLPVEEVAEIIEERVEEVKEELSESPEESVDVSDQSLLETVKEGVRERASWMAHELFEEFAKLGEAGIGLLGDYETKLQSYRESVDAGHEWIDGMFSTHYTPKYDSEFKEFLDATYEQLGIKLTYAVVVPPGSLATALGRAIVAAGAVEAGLSVATAVEGGIAVYRAVNETTGTVSYVGITNNVPRRRGEHRRETGREIEPIRGLTNLPRETAQCVEQALIEVHGLEKNGGTLTNRINSIAEKNPIRAEAVKRGLEILREIEYDGLEGILE